MCVCVCVCVCVSSLVISCLFSSHYVEYLIRSSLRNKIDFWSVHGFMDTSGLLQSKVTLQETRSVQS